MQLPLQRLPEIKTPMPIDEVHARLARLNGWTLEGHIIRKIYTLNSYMAGLAFATAIGTICEGMHHHPESLLITWGKVTVSFTTHSAGDALTSNDFDVAEAIDLLPYRKPA